MIFYCNSEGIIEQTIPSRIFQGQAYDATIYFYGEFENNCVLSLAFELPDGTWTHSATLSIDSSIEAPTGYSVWSYKLPQAITELYGKVMVQFYVFDGTTYTTTEDDEEKTYTKIIATASSSFVVEKGVPYTDEVEQGQESEITTLKGEIARRVVRLTTTEGNYVYTHEGENDSSREIVSSLDDITTGGGKIPTENVIAELKQTEETLINVKLTKKVIYFNGEGLYADAEYTEQLDYNAVKELVDNTSLLVQVWYEDWGVLFYYGADNGEAIWFNGRYRIDDVNYLCRVIINTDSEILFNKDAVEDSLNKVSVITENATDKEYPSAKAVYNALSNIDLKNYYTKEQTDTQIYNARSYIDRVGFTGTLSNNVITFELDSSQSDFKFENHKKYILDCVFYAVGELDNDYEIRFVVDDKIVYLNTVSSSKATVGDLLQLQNYNTQVGYDWEFEAVYLEFGEIVEGMEIDHYVFQTFNTIHEVKSITVDDAISSTSENPVQNKVIYSNIKALEESVAGKARAFAIDYSNTYIQTLNWDKYKDASGNQYFASQTEAQNFYNGRIRNADFNSSVDFTISSNYCFISNWYIIFPKDLMIGDIIYVTNTDVPDRWVSNASSDGGAKFSVLEARKFTITIDSELSTTSENAVQNKVITSALADKQPKEALSELNFDNII